MSKVSSLTEREKEVVRCILEGKSNKQIASALSISLRTVEQHLTNIYDKLGVANRSEAFVLLVSKLHGIDLRLSAQVQIG